MDSINKKDAFLILKETLSSAPVLALQNFSKPFMVTTDASGQAIGGVLSQEGKPISFESRKLRDHELYYPTHDLELLAIVHALKIWCHYLLGNHFSIKTDHKSLKWIFTQPDLNMRQRQWMELLQEYNFTIKYQPGKENTVANALSRKSLAATIALIQTTIADLIRQSLRNDPFYNRIITILLPMDKSQKDHRVIKGFCLEEGLLYYKDRVYILADKELKINILAKAHDGPTAAHPGCSPRVHQNL